MHAAGTPPGFHPYNAIGGLPSDFYKAQYEQALAAEQTQMAAMYAMTSRSSPENGSAQRTTITTTNRGTYKNGPRYGIGDEKDVE